MLDSQPAPAKSKPRLTMSMLRLRLMRISPKVAVDHVRIIPNLLPKLSEKCMKMKYPTKMPTNKTILYVEVSV